MNNEVKEIIIDLITHIWKIEKEHYVNAGEYNMREAELTDIYYELEEKIGALEQKTLGEYEEDIEELEEELEYARGQVDELADKNCELKEENEKLWGSLKEISKVVNDTWN